MCRDLTYIQGFESLNMLIAVVFQVQNIAIVMTVIYLKNIQYLFDDMPQIKHVGGASVFMVFKDPDR